MSDKPGSVAEERLFKLYQGKICGGGVPREKALKEALDDLAFYEERIQNASSEKLEETQ